MNCLNRERASKISALVREVEKLSDTEKLLLYLQLPYGRAESSDGAKHKVANNKHHSDIFAKKSDQETTQTYTWILSHLEEDPNVSLPKQEVYDEYRAFCQQNHFEPLCVADFGKAMKHALPCIKPRRLGQRGNSRYCYSGLRKKYRIEAPSLPNITSSVITSSASSASSSSASSSAAAAAAAASQVAIVKVDNSAYYEHNSTATTIKSECTSQISPTSAPPPPQQSTNNFTCAQQITTSAGSCTYTPQHPHHTSSGGSSAATTIRCKLEPCTISGAAPLPSQLPECCRPPAPLSEYHNNHLQPLLTPGAQQATGSHYVIHHHQQQQPGVFAHHRCASPDDDEYGHNYHDLNRPVVGPAVIPFSPSLPVQLAQQPASNHTFISYTNNCVGGRLDGAHQSVQPQQQQKKRGACCEQDQKMVRQNSPIKQQDNDSSSSSPNHQFNSSNSNNNNSLHHHHPHMHQHNQQQHEHDTLHLNLSLLDSCTASSHMDFCTSPFQSPASTPYPQHQTTNYTTTGSGAHNDLMQDYYQSAGGASGGDLGLEQYADPHQ